MAGSMRRACLVLCLASLSCGGPLPPELESALGVATTVTLTIRSTDLAGNALPGLPVQVSQGDSPVGAGTTPLAVTVAAGLVATVCVSGGEFVQWKNGDTSTCRDVTPDGDAFMMAEVQAAAAP
jgi:hypothetical protein